MPYIKPKSNYSASCFNLNHFTCKSGTCKCECHKKLPSHKIEEYA